MSCTPHTVLVVDDGLIIAELFRNELIELGFVVCGVADTTDRAIEMARDHSPELILMDVRLRHGGDGIETARLIGETLNSRFIFITGSCEPETLVRIQARSPAATLTKPVNTRQLRQAVETALSRPAAVPIH